MKLAIGCDEAACGLKEVIKSYMHAQCHEVHGFGMFDRVPVLYPDVGIKLAEAVIAGAFERGILMCGTGIDMAITANKVRGIRATQCHDTYSAERAQRSNNVEIITLGPRVVGTELAKTIVDRHLMLNFDGDNSAAKIACIAEYESEPRRECERSTSIVSRVKPCTRRAKPHVPAFSATCQHLPGSSVITVTPPGVNCHQP